MRDYKYAVYVGRFQPFHNGHLEVIRNGLEIAEQVIVVVGSIGAAPNTRNPWSFEERRTMIWDALPEVTGIPTNRGPIPVEIVGVRDHFYNDNTWVAEVQAQTDRILQGEESVALLGSYKDASSYYLKYFPQWEFVPTKAPPVDGTDIRNRIFREREVERRLDVVKSLPLPKPVREAVYGWAGSTAGERMAQEWQFVEQYQAAWASAPFPPMFVTTDAVVVCSGHVLVVERKHNPGKGLYALPGGFLKDTQRIQDSMLRELKEETKIKLDKIILESSIVDSFVFDHPERSLRGRTITHGYYLKLKDGRLPEVKADDDASDAFWMPLMDVAKNERRFFEDHVHIINYFVGLS